MSPCRAPVASARPGSAPQPPYRTRKGPPGDRAVLLACSVRTLRSLWLEVRCPCRTTFLPLRLMASNHGLAGCSLADVLVQLRCRECHQRPASVAVAADAAGQMVGRMSPPGWSVVLVGE